MKFKHTFNVFIDNFNVVYKQLLYRIVVMLVAAAINIAAIYPFISSLLASESMTMLVDGIGTFVRDFLGGNVADLHVVSVQIGNAFDELIILLQTKMSEIVLCGVVVILVLMVQKWFTSIGNFATATLVNDKMALQAKTGFLRTIISNFRTSSVYSLIYAPICILYDCLMVTVLITIVYFYITTHFLPLLFAILMFSLIIVAMNVLKMTFTTDWLPSLIAGKMKQGEAIKHTFSVKNKNIWNVASNYFVLVLLIIAINMVAIFFTLMAGLLLTVPASFLMLICFEMVNFYDHNEIRYFTDKNTIIKPNVEKQITRQDFFKGNE